MSDVDDLTLGEVLEVVERLYPPATAQSWDRVGLVTGDPRQPVRRVHLAVDPTLAVIEEARAPGPTCWSPTTRCCCAGVSASPRPRQGADRPPASSRRTSRCTWRTPTPTSRPTGVSDALARACGLTATVRCTVPRTSPWAGSAASRAARPARLRRAGWRPDLPRGPGRHPGGRSAGCRAYGASPSSAAPGTSLFDAVRPAAPTSTSPPTCATTPPVEHLGRPPAAPPCVDAAHWATERSGWPWPSDAGRRTCGRALGVETRVRPATPTRGPCMPSRPDPRKEPRP